MVSKKAIKCARLVCKRFNVKVKFQKLEEVYGIAQPWKNQIYIDPNIDDQDMFLTTLFHEIQHVLNYRNRKYFHYHKGNSSRKEMRKWGLRAEIYTDKKAKQLAKILGFTDYKTCYSNSKYWKKHFKEYYS